MNEARRFRRSALQGAGDFGLCRRRPAIPDPQSGRPLMGVGHLTTLKPASTPKILCVPAVLRILPSRQSSSHTRFLVEDGRSLYIGHSTPQMLVQFSESCYECHNTRQSASDRQSDRRCIRSQLGGSNPMALPISTRLLLSWLDPTYLFSLKVIGQNHPRTVVARPTPACSKD